MRLIRDHSPGAYAVQVACIICGRSVLEADVVIDVDGPAFRAFYCDQHVPVGVPVRPCDRDGCPRCPGGGRAPSHRVGEEVTAYDEAAKAMGMSPWQPARVVDVLYEDDAWWVRVQFRGGRMSMLKPAGCRKTR